MGDVDGNGNHHLRSSERAINSIIELMGRHKEIAFFIESNWFKMETWHLMRGSVRFVINGTKAEMQHFP